MHIIAALILTLFISEAFCKSLTDYFQNEIQIRKNLDERLKQRANQQKEDIESQFPISDNIEYSYPKNNSIKIDSEKLGKCMALIANKFKPNLRSKERILKCEPFQSGDKNFKTPNMFDYLSASRMRKCDYSTGKEEELKSWVMQQKDNSVDILKIFQKSLELNSGNLTESFITIHTLLRNLARYDNGSQRRSGRYYYQSSPDEVKNFFNKFIDIRGDLVERDKMYYGDHKGSWYRIWGVFIGRFELYNKTKLDMTITNCESGFAIIPKNFFNFFDDFISKSMLKFVEKGEKRGFEKDSYKYELSLQSAETIESFVKYIQQSEATASSDAEINNCNNQSYLVVR